jgi:hypothetical protein
MSISNIQATKFFDEMRAHFGHQTRIGTSIALVIQSGQMNDSIFVGVSDDNNSNAKPLILMKSRTRAGRRWSNEISPNTSTYHVVNAALTALSKQIQEWEARNFLFQPQDATDFLVKFMKRVSDFLR